jgi:DNA-binding IclR family transcriptional regulator
MNDAPGAHPESTEHERASMNDLAAASARHRIPVIDRMMDVLALLERRADGASIRELVERTALPRTTVYRILNTLQLHAMVLRSANGDYRLGPRLLALAARAAERGGLDLPALARPHLERLSAATGEACKLSVVDDGGLLVCATAEGKREYALTVVPGQRLPLHAGAAGKVLLAHMAPEALARVLARPLERHTARTFTDPKRLARELARIRRQGFAEDRGEYSPSIHAIAAPIRDRGGTVVAALSVPFLAGAAASHVETIRAAVIATAGAIAADLPASRS